MNKDTRKYWLWLSHVCGQGSKNAVTLVRHYGDAETIYKLKPEKIQSDGFIKDKISLSRLARTDLSEEEEIVYWCEKNDVQILTPYDDKYPKSLLSLRDAPMVLYVVGELPDFDNYLTCAVVGTRKMSDYGKKVSYNLGTGIADGGAILVSGLALGCDGMAMAGAIEAGGKTIAVLGCGIDVVYPKEHEHLLEKVVENGAVITEYAPGVSPAGAHFPVRNRIISGISQAVCVVEGNMSSGSLITARHALYQGKDLYAVPGKVDDSGADGTNQLIKQGARLVTSAEDILTNYEFFYPHTLSLNSFVPHISADDAADNLQISRRITKANKNEIKKKKEKTDENPFSTFEEKPVTKHIDFDSLSDDDKKVYDFMVADVPMLAEEIAKCGLPLQQILVSLTMLEVSGAVEAGAGGYYLKRASDTVDLPDYITEEDIGI